MRLLILTDMWPHPRHSVRAANVVIFELIAALAREAGVHPSLLRVHRGTETAPTDEERAGLQALAGLGVDLLPALVIPPPKPPRPALLRAWRPSEIDFVPEVAHRDLLRAAVDRAAPDLVLIVWSEWLTALAATLPQAKFSYYGNPPPKNYVAGRAWQHRHGNPGFQGWRQDIYYRRFEAIHLEHMRGYQYLGDVAANDVAYYQQAGHPNAFYIRNLWVDRFGGPWRARRGAARPHIIVGNIGRLSATANGYGLEILARDFLPALRRRLPAGSFELHVIGAGEPHPAIARLLEQPEIRRRGFVDDIDAEIGEASLFLCLNNASLYKVGHTRYLHAWSLGAAVAAHADVRLSMPELADGENAVLGATIDELADKVAAALPDEAYRARIGAAGYDTFRRLFTADKVAPEILRRVGVPMSRPASPSALTETKGVP
jgi:glycosyltransferase involved in cell wall biosynthesis